MKNKHLLLSAILFLLAVFGVLMVNMRRDDHFNLAQREIRLRQIGHEILLHSGDSTSRVLPVQQLTGEKYRLVFEKPFTFSTDTLVSIVRQSLASKGETPDYIVNVLNCSRADIVYGYSVSSRQKSDVIPCSDRKQPVDCYVITIAFQDAPFGIRKYVAAMSALAIALLCPFIVWRYRKKKPQAPQLPPTENQLIAIGKILFDKSKKQLILSNETVNLTAKENKILYIFAQNPNQVIDRARLQKEIWEDDGIIVGRSLDVFISKLRKKLESDAAVQLVNIHGKGYKLQIQADEI